MSKNARFCPNCGTPVPSSAGLRIQQDVGTVKGEVVGTVLGEGATTGGLNASTTQKVAIVEACGSVVGTIVGSEGGHVHVGGRQQYGDTVHGDQITVGDISGGTSVAIGRGAQATVTQGLGGDEIDRLFEAIHQRIEARPEDPDMDKEVLTETVQKIQQEAAKGEEANPNKVERWLKTLSLMASDIF